jgi:hypothetical protein
MDLTTLAAKAYDLQARLDALMAAGPEQSAVSTATLTIGNTTTPTPISGPLAYAAGEAVVNSEYEIEIAGVITTGSGAAQALTFALYVDGTLLGGALNAGGVLLAASLAYNFQVTSRLSVTTTGAGGDCTATSWGVFLRQAANIGAAATAVDGSGASVGTAKAFDTTTAHTIRIYASWAGTNTGQQAQTFRTRTTRRD